jgi:hypothetical protein
MSPACGNCADDPVATVFGQCQTYVAMRCPCFSPRPHREAGDSRSELLYPQPPPLCFPLHYAHLPLCFTFYASFASFSFLRRSHGQPAGSMHTTSTPTDHPPALPGRGAAGAVISPTRSLAARGDSYGQHTCSTRIQRLPLAPSSGCLGPELRPSSDIFEPFGLYGQMQCSEELSIHEWDWGASRPPCARMQLIRSGLPRMLWQASNAPHLLQGDHVLWVFDELR